MTAIGFFTVNEPGINCSNRVFEWVTTSMMLGIALTLLLSPDAIQNSTFRLMLGVGFSQGAVAFFFVIVGGFRIVALFANGRLPIYGPLVRSFAALAGALIWGQMAIALLGMSHVTGTVSPGVAVYLALVGGELYSCFRAVNDGRHYPA
jgi:hypothetical protein